MSHVLSSPSPTESVRRVVVRAWNDPDSRSIGIGILGVLLVHLLLLVVGPRLLRFEHAPSVIRPHSSSRQFNIVIAPDTFPRPVPKPPVPKQFVETNPDAPENIPDKTNNFAAQNQQVAQEKATPNGESERPAIDGKKDFQSNQIVDGHLQKLTEVVPVAPSAPETPAQTAPTPPRLEQNPLSGFEKTQGDNLNAFGSTAAPKATDERPIPNKVEGAKGVPLIEGATGLQPVIDPKRPRPRPMIVKQQQVRPAILAENTLGTQNVGVTAINAKFSNYGAYLQRLVEAVQLEWESILSGTKAFPSGTYVVVRFVINSEGKVVSFKEVDNHSTDYGQGACTAAITNRAPYGEWTEDMKATLNPDGEELLFTFHYQ